MLFILVLIHFYDILVCAKRKAMLWLRPCEGQMFVLGADWSFAKGLIALVGLGHCMNLATAGLFLFALYMWFGDCSLFIFKTFQGVVIKSFSFSQIVAAKYLHCCNFCEY